MLTFVSFLLTAFQSSFPQFTFSNVLRNDLGKAKCIFKSPGMRIYLVFQINRCIYDNKHASKQISWIDEFQNEKDNQLSLVNIVPFRYRAALLHWL